MKRTSAQLSFSQQIKLLILEKGLLALISALIVFLLSWQLQIAEGKVNYQEKLFSQRQSAYIAILKEAREARDLSLILFLEGNGKVSSVNTELAWKNKLESLEGEVHSLLSGSRGSSFWTRDGYLDAIIKAINSLKEVDSLRNKNSLYISSNIDVSIDDFISKNTQILEELIKQIEPDSKGFSIDSQFEKKAWENTVNAYDSLLKEIRESLGIEEIIVG